VHRRTRALTSLLAIVLGGCASLEALVPAAGPTPCDAMYSVTRCELLAIAASTQTRIEPSDMIEIRIVPPPTPEVTQDGTVLHTLGGATPIVLEIVARDGLTRQATLCGGVPTGPACMDDPALQPMSVTLSGYRDVPCFDDEGANCATPHPSIDPRVEVLSEPLHIERLDIPIDRAGLHEIPVGSGTLANGVLTEASFRFVVDWPEDLLISSGTVLLDVRSLASDGRPFDNYYLHGWRDGLESFEAVLVFTVDRSTPGATLSVADVVVR
jgi:hypothetical protein